MEEELVLLTRISNTCESIFESWKSLVTPFDVCIATRKGVWLGELLMSMIPRILLIPQIFHCRSRCRYFTLGLDFGKEDG